jgi:uncharacterized protein (TIGR03435 family)
LKGDSNWNKSDACGVEVTMFLVPLLLAQQFDVASVKPYREKQLSEVFQIAPNGDIRIANKTLRELVRSAYMLHESQLQGGPEWFASDRWNIEAKVGDARVSKKESLLRLKNLIDQRFQIATHRKSRPMTILALTQAKSGHKLKPAVAGEERRLHGGGLGMVFTKRFDMEGLAAILSGMLGRIVRDETGLTGEFAFDLEWTPDPMTERLPGQPADLKPTDSAPGPSLYEALQRQLGLRIVSKKAPVDVVIVDRASRPKPN